MSLTLSPLREAESINVLEALRLCSDEHCRDQEGISNYGFAGSLNMVELRPIGNIQGKEKKNTRDSPTEDYCVSCAVNEL